MPRWNRGRITGLKYENMKKQYEDMVFEFNNGEEAVHTLISLINGGGKGVLLQAFFQLMKPGTAWGATENRLYQQFFFNEKEKFQAYPFHIVMEWELDGNDRRYLITGGVFSAERQATKSEDENDYDIKPKFLLYVKEVEIDDTGLFEFLPLYDGGQAISMDVLEKWLKEQGFATFERVAKYHEVLKSYGIDKKDWDTLKEINKNEGGVGAYFEGATDDYSLFRTKIVPMISKRLQQQDSGQDDLVEIFKSQASIAKNLPILLSRESAFKEFLAELAPLQQEVGKGVELEKQQTEHEKSGQRLLAAIRHVITGLNDTLAIMQQRLDETGKSLRQLAYEKDNLYYARLAREVQALRVKMVENEDRLSALVTRKEDIDSQYKHVELSIKYRYWEKAQQAFAEVCQRIEMLENSESAREIKEQMDQVAMAAAEQWKILEIHLQDEINRYAALEQRLLENEKAQEEQREKQRTKLSRLEIEQERLNDESATYESKKRAFVSRYGEEVAYQIDKALQLYQERKKDTVDLIEEKMVKLTDTDAAILANTAGLASAEERCKALDEECEALAAKIPEQEQKERQLLDRVATWLQDHVETASRLSVEHTEERIARLLTHYKKDLESAKHALWQKQIAVSLNGKDFWIANPDLKRIYERLSAHMDVFYGTQFLRTLNDKQREEELAKHPLLPFGLVVFSQDWKRTRLEDELAAMDLQSPVPLFLREEMKESGSASYVLVSGQAATLSLHLAAYTRYKEGVEGEWQAAASHVNELERSIAEIEGINRDLVLLLSHDLADEISSQLQAMEEVLEDLRLERQRYTSREGDLQEIKRKISYDLARLQQEAANYDEVLRNLNAFQEEWRYHEVRCARLAELDIEISKARSALQATGMVVETLHGEINQWKQAYWEWSRDVKQKLEQLAIAVPNAAFPAPKTNVDATDVSAPTLRDDVFQKVLEYASQFKQLNSSREEQNTELAKLSVDRGHKEQKLMEMVAQIEMLTPQWREAQILTEPLEVLEGRQSNLSLLRYEQDRLISNVEKSLTAEKAKMEAKCEMMEDHERKIVENHAQAAQAWDELDLDQKEREIVARKSQATERMRILNEQKTDAEGRKTALGQNEASLASHVDADGITFGEDDLQAAEYQAGKAASEWRQARVGLVSELDGQRKRIGRKITAIQELIEERSWDAQLKKGLIGSFSHVEGKRCDIILDTMEGMIRFCEKSMTDLERDKAQALQAQSYWANRAAMKIVSLSDAIRHMIAKMSVKNDFGIYPLAKLEEDILPRRPEDVEPLLKEHFVDAIDKIIKQFDVIDDHNKKLNDEIKKLVGDEEILFVGLRRRYPTLLVYNMNTENALTYSRPRREHYKTWKTINEGSATTADGSGGQKLAARTVIMMMLLSMKNDTDQYWMTMVCDNPLGQAVSAHVLDPIFEVAKKLKFQLIFVTPPELVKTEVSKRFPVYYKLDFREQRGKEYLQQQVQYSYRMYEKNQVI
ncbi:hypothetical protein [Paenibacillus sp. B01]|uniref:hypothetical protein n=1 Tax=Paenibacillus sp. B01 TaxID=2660554 RepID=UPI00129C0278|nr:hypothetical protein [Paenibacillus sp. B01]QGG57831.1 hypothetical protein GE073_21190 [Paenibacillus sp. B01]